MATVSSLRHLPLAAQASSAKKRPSDRGAAAPAAEQTLDWDDDKLLQVGDLARLSGKTVRAIHLYEQVGLLRPHGRSKGRYRLYDGSSLTRLRWIGKLSDLGLSLTQIQEMLTAWEASPSAPDAMATVRATYAKKLDETRAQIERLAALEGELVASLDYLDACETCVPTELVVACSNCNLHDASTEPELVAGIHGGSGARPAQAASRCGSASEQGEAGDLNEKADFTEPRS